MESFGSQQVLWCSSQGLDNSPLVIMQLNLCMRFGRVNKFYGAVAGDRRIYQINIMTKEGNTILDILKKKNKNSFSSSGYF